MMSRPSSRSRSVSPTNEQSEINGTAPQAIPGRDEEGRPEVDTPFMRQRSLETASVSQSGFPSQDLDTVHLQLGESTLRDDSTPQTPNPRAPTPQTATFKHAVTLGGRHSLREESLSAAQHTDSPVDTIRNDFEELRQSQEDMPSNPSATRRLPTRSDFPASINLEIVQPVIEHQLEFAVVMLQDHVAARPSLEHLARRLQHQYPENAYILIRSPDTKLNRHGWADPQSDYAYLATSRMLLIHIIRQGLVTRCGFKPRHIIVLGHGQGGTAALTAVSWWNSVQFAGAISIGGALPARSPPSEVAKAQTPALLLGSMPRTKMVSTLQRANNDFIHVSHAIQADLQESAIETFDLSETMLGSITEFFAHRLRREEWTKQAIISFGKQSTFWPYCYPNMGNRWWWYQGLR